MKVKRIVLFILCLCATFLLGYIIGHSRINRIDAAETHAYYDRDLEKNGFGMVLSATKRQLTVTEYDFDTDRDVTRAYELQPQTYLGNFKSTKDLKPGDDVVFTYMEMTDSRRVILVIVKEQRDDDEKYEAPNEEQKGRFKSSGEARRKENCSIIALVQREIADD